MTARLHAVAGPLEGSAFPLPEGEFSIGRDDDNLICVAADDHASRRHAVIHAQHQQFTLRDCTGRGRTYVNQLAVDERLLEHGDEIRIGRSVFVFLLDAQPGTRVDATVDLDDGAEVSGSTQIAHKGDALYFDRDQVLEALPRAADRGRVVQALLRATRAVLADHSLHALQRQLVASIADAIAVDRCALLQVGAQQDEFASALHWTRESGECQGFRIPRAVIRHVLAERTALCINDAAYTVWSSQTALQARLSSLIAVPLLSNDVAAGVIYADVSNPAVRFVAGDVQLLTGIAELSAAPLASALRMAQVEAENERLIAELTTPEPLVGSSERMRSVRRFVNKVAASDATVLVLGASGTGKELVARAIHRTSTRARKPFVAINCAAVTDTLLESEFFGHEKGAFTGAYAQKKGKLEQAEGGTVFLDEIGELALPLQAKLLRVLQEREFERVGGTRPLKIDVRIIAATNRNLEHEIKRGAFRQDLFYRLNVVAVTMPELRDRREDIPMLAAYFLRKHAKTTSRRLTGFSAEALACLSAYDWPGNVRELENAIERAMVLGTTAQILPDDLPEAVVESAVVPSPAGTKFHETIKQIKKQMVIKALDQAGGNHTEAAKSLGLHPNNLHRLLRTLDLRH
jgi:Nif-specific regulatory protein